MKYKYHNELKVLSEKFPLNNSEYENLKSLLVSKGQLMPILLWNGYVVDGHNRLSIMDELGIEPYFKDVHFDSLDDAKLFIINNYIGQRNLTDGQKYEANLEKKEILLSKGRENKVKAGREFHKGSSKDLSNVDKTFNHDTRKEIASELGWSTGKVAMADKVWKQAKPEVKEKIKTGEVSFNQAYTDIQKEEKKKEKEEQRNTLAEIGAKKQIQADLRHGDFEQVLADISDGSVDCIITDPPYPHQYIECWSKLSRFAKRVLKPNGFCVAYSGQMYLPEVMQRMNEHLDYYWTFAVYHEGQTQIINGINLICRWKPVLIYQNGKKKIDNTFQDYFISESREKDGHDWQQSKSGVAYLIEMFTNPGDLIVEPFAGSGTTMKVAMEKKREVIGAEIDERTYNIARANL